MTTENRQKSSRRTVLAAITGLTSIALGGAIKQNAAPKETSGPASNDATSTFVGKGFGDLSGFSAALASLSSGQTLVVEGTVGLSSTVAIDTPDVRIEFAPGARIVTDVTNADAITINASGVTVSGAEIHSPQVFDATNATPTFGVVRITAEDVSVDGLRLTNVPTVGIFFDGVRSGTVSDCTIRGNYPADSWTGSETAHFGIAYDPSENGGRIKITGNHIMDCVQGIFLGNYGAGSNAYGCVIAGNILEGCHNHGVYSSSGTDACSITANTFARCSMPIALTGRAHAITGNTMYTHATGHHLDVSSVSIREAIDCIITGNTIVGDAAPDTAVVDLSNYKTDSFEISRNIISDNTIYIKDGMSVVIRLGRDGHTRQMIDNVISNNIIRAPGIENLGVITLAPSPGKNYGNRVLGNTITLHGLTHGIFARDLSHLTIHGNSFRFEANSVTPKIVGGVTLAKCKRPEVSGNTFYTAPGFGLNMNIRALYELPGNSDGQYGPNNYDASNASSFTSLSLAAGTSPTLNESGPGVPTFFAAPGSVWRRTDGGAGSTFYVKETGALESTWAAK
ncbi:right-handed parallel beta-helix repeat-containing protein [Microbacterium sp. A93]|uniref:right-handed parallel beta-helix repeat-containing protein n=1 Tax=Microbacterium sp. A93 TaxID=3450716 RepID=UPI003F427B75